MSQGVSRHPPGGCQNRYSCRSVAVEVGFEPTEDLRLHTLSSTAHHRPPAFGPARMWGPARAAGAGLACAGRRGENVVVPQGLRPVRLGVPLGRAAELGVVAGFLAPAAAGRVLVV